MAFEGFPRGIFGVGREAGEGVVPLQDVVPRNDVVGEVRRDGELLVHLGDAEVGDFTIKVGFGLVGDDIFDLVANGAHGWLSGWWSCIYTSFF